MPLIVNSSTSNTPSSSGLIAHALEWLANGDKIALITLVSIEGNAPYPVGTQMLVNQNGDYLGQITGGCAEVALAEQAVNVIDSGKNVTQRYGLGSIFFDIQLPCGSGIDVYIDVQSKAEEYETLNQQLISRSVVDKVIKSECGLFTKTYQPNERLILFGQGPILISLAQLALTSGFEVICIPQKTDDANELKVLGVKATVLDEAQGEFRDYCDPFTGLVSLFHEHSYEMRFLQTALETDLFYIGALGSKQTQVNRLNALRDVGCEDAKLKRILGPVGLDIKAETPAQIAVSIMAQIIAQKPKLS